MRYKTLARSFLSLLLLLTIVHFAATLARAAADDDNNDDNYSDDYEETARVARISLLAGDVSLRRAGSDKWERAALNAPLVEGDRLATGASSRVEIQIDARNFVRVGEYATLDIVTLRDEGVALSLPEGTATLRLARFDHAHEYFEIDAPGTTIAAERTGLYRLDVEHDGKVRVSVRDSGLARIYSESSGFTLRDGRTASMVKVGSSDEADWDFAELRPFDNWDSWVDERERYLLARLRYDNRDRYYDSQVYGAEELDAYGDWVQTGDYGYVWRPHSAVINIYNDWAPYRYGHWDWCPPYGWTWVGDEAWGWAPYHYGRWVYVNNYWCWAPRGYYGYGHRAWWRPALVAFVDVNLSFGGGERVCWYPLPYHHRDPRSNFWRHARDNSDPHRRKELADLQRQNPIYRNAVSGLNKNDFSRGGVRPQPTDPQLAKLALSTDPIRGRLPIRPVEGADGEANMRARLSADKRAVLASRGGNGGGAATDDPNRHTFDRPTGAAKRLPGVALDDELRRSRILNNREPATKAAKGAGGDASDPARRTVGDPNRRRVGGDERGDGGATERRDDNAGARRDGPDNRGDGDARSTGVFNRPSRSKSDGSAKGGGDKSGDGSGDDKSGSRKGGSDERERVNQDHANENTDRNLSPYERGARPAPRETNNETRERERSNSESRAEKHKSPPADEQQRREPPQEERHTEQPAPHYERTEPRREERPSPPREERSAPSHQERPSAPSKSEERHSEPSKSEPSKTKPPQRD